MFAFSGFSSLFRAIRQRYVINRALKTVAKNHEWRYSRKPLKTAGEYN